MIEIFGRVIAACFILMGVIVAFLIGIAAIYFLVGLIKILAV